MWWNSQPQHLSRQSCPGWHRPHTHHKAPPHIHAIFHEEDCELFVRNRCASIHEVAPNSAAAGKVSRRRQPNFGRHAGAQAGKVAAARLMGLCFTMVRPHVEYANSIWSPYKKGDIEAIEKVQKSYKISDITQKVTIQRTFITIKFTYFEIQTITWRDDRGIQNYSYVWQKCCTRITSKCT